MRGKEHIERPNSDSAPVAISSSNLATALHDFEKKFPQDELWRLIVDGILYARLPDANYSKLALANEDGWIDYEERESGCLQAFFDTWSYCLEQLKQQSERVPLCWAFIEELHRRVTHNVETQDFDGPRAGANSVYFCFDSACLHRYTKEGLGDLLGAFAKLQSARLLIGLEGIAAGKSFLDNVLALSAEKNADLLELKRRISGFERSIQIEPQARGYDPDSCRFREGWVDLMRLTELLGIEKITNLAWHLLQKFPIQYQAPQGSDVSGLVASAIDHYNAEIVKVTSDDDKLLLIAKLIQTFERIHPFADANGRVFVNLLLNYLLLQEGFPPAIFFDPNIFDMNHEMVDEIKKGMANTLAMYHGKRDLFGYSHNDMQEAINNHSIKLRLDASLQLLGNFSADLSAGEKLSVTETDEMIRAISAILADDELCFVWHFLSEKHKKKGQKMLDLFDRMFPELFEAIKLFENKNISELIKTGKISPSLVNLYQKDLAAEEKKASFSSSKHSLFTNTDKTNQQEDELLQCKSDLVP